MWGPPKALSPTPLTGDATEGGGEGNPPPAQQIPVSLLPIIRPWVCTIMQSKAPHPKIWVWGKGPLPPRARAPLDRPPQWLSGHPAFLRSGLGGPLPPPYPRPAPTLGNKPAAAKVWASPPAGRHGNNNSCRTSRHLCSSPAHCPPRHLCQAAAGFAGPSAQTLAPRQAARAQLAFFYFSYPPFQPYDRSASDAASSPAHVAIETRTRPRELKEQLQENEGGLCRDSSRMLTRA